MVYGAELVGDYPMVRCSEVHRDKPARAGYAVCVHVSWGADVAIHLAPTAHEFGHIVCHQCLEDERSNDPQRQARVLMALDVECPDCVEYHLGARLPLAEPEWPAVTVQ